MIQKKVLTNIISKYYLNGNVEKVTWICKKEENANTLTLNFINDARTFIGKLYCDKINMKEGDYGVYSTSQLNKVINILDGELMMDVEKHNGILSKLTIADTNFDSTFSLADPKVLPKNPSIKELDSPTIIFNTTDEFFNRFIKSKNALSEAEYFSISSGDGFNGKEIIFSIQGNAGNKVDFIVDSGISKYEQDVKEPIWFSAEVFKEILRSNIECNGVIKIYKEGIIQCDFTEALDDQNITSNYYLVKQQNK